ncbi:hypothetical protein KP509_19G040100 [Ceratopteris richardii]|uniref:Uncharacterized protein n=1 Tax=Ceratopteris richardii TaxID=49495 RepID=A0A8T2SJY9_CERRI|nr:hypothetical protein KP509_19G040100 [Ceratopteris richardii]KAH7352330.1 hypothetical protein KP509_19G040100 [Ceratopteris richardii]
MPGLRFLPSVMTRTSNPDDGTRRFVEVAAKTFSDFRRLSEGTMLAFDRTRAEVEPIQKSSRIAVVLPGNLIHLSQSADGKLRWNPPSLSVSFLNEGIESSCLSGERGAASVVDPAPVKCGLLKSLTEVNATIGRDNPNCPCEDSISSLTSCCDHIYSDSSKCLDSSDDSNVRHISSRSEQIASSCSEARPFTQADGSASKSSADVRESFPSRMCGLSPYLCSKLKPGRHILGVRRPHNYIRPGQLRHWAIVKSPSLNLAELPDTSVKVKACRNLAF